MSINFPNAPVIGDMHSEEGSTWQWDGVAWIFLSSAEVAARIEYTNVAGQTVFTAASGGEHAVHLNGVLLAAADYASAGDQVTLAAAIADAADILIIETLVPADGGGAFVLKAGDDMSGRLSLNGVNYALDQAPLSVDPAGSPNPANPFAGDPFDSLTSLRNYVSPGSDQVMGFAITIAAGTYADTGRIDFENCRILIDGTVTLNGDAQGGYTAYSLVNCFVATTAAASGTANLNINVSNTNAVGVALLITGSTTIGDSGLQVNQLAITNNTTGANGLNFSKSNVTMFIGGAIVTAEGLCVLLTTSTIAIIAPGNFNVEPSAATGPAVSGIDATSGSTITVSPGGYFSPAPARTLGFLASKNSAILSEAGFAGGSTFSPALGNIDRYGAFISDGSSPLTPV